MTDLIVSGPLEDLADVVLAVELIGRRVGEAPALTVTSEVIQCKEVARRALARMDRLLFQISPQGLEEEGLVTSVRRVGADLMGIVTVRVQVVGEERRLAPVDRPGRLPGGGGGDRERLPARPQPRRWRWCSPSCPGRLQVVVADHGEGFDVGATEARLGRTRALGLISMRERVENVGGSFEIRSALGAGPRCRAIFATTWQ